MKKRIGKLVCRIFRRHRWRVQGFTTVDVARSTAAKAVQVTAPVCRRCGAVDVDRITFAEQARKVEKRAVPRGRRRRRPGR